MERGPGRALSSPGISLTGNPTLDTPTAEVAGVPTVLFVVVATGEATATGAWSPGVAKEATRPTPRRPTHHPHPRTTEVAAAPLTNQRTKKRIVTRKEVSTCLPLVFLKRGKTFSSHLKQ